MKICDLREHPEHIVALSAWHHAEWSYLNPGKTLEDRINKMRDYLGDNKIPTMLIAIEGDDLLGSAALIESDMDTHPELTPWLANVYVREDKRGLGVGGKLVRAIMQLAKDYQLPRIYLFTPDQEAFYAKMGWTRLSHENYHNAPVTIMQLDL